VAEKVDGLNACATPDRFLGNLRPRMSAKRIAVDRQVLEAVVAGVSACSTRRYGDRALNLRRLTRQRYLR